MRSPALKVLGLPLLALLVCQAKLAALAEDQATWPRVPSPRRGSKPFNIEVSGLLGAKGMVILRVFPGEQKDLEELGGDTRPAKVCVAKGPAESCYVARARETNFARDVQASIVDLGEGHAAVLFQAGYLGLNDEWKLVAVLGLGSRRRFVNVLPMVVISMQDQFRLWRDAEISDGELITAAQYVWRSRPPEETHFSAHHYQISTYQFCPSAGRYLLVDQFVTKKSSRVKVMQGTGYSTPRCRK